LLARYLAASEALATAARANADAQQQLAANLAGAIEKQDAAAVRSVLAEMTQTFQVFFARLQDAERAWNALTPAVAGDV
jgi:hypothetical protein